MFPWLGTRSFRALRKALGRISSELGISGIDYEGCYYIKFRMERGTQRELIARLASEFDAVGDNVRLLVGGSELPIFEKYDRYIPAELLRSSYAVDKLNVTEAKGRVNAMLEKYRL